MTADSTVGGGGLSRVQRHQQSRLTFFREIAAVKRPQALTQNLEDDETEPPPVASRSAGRAQACGVVRPHCPHWPGMPIPEQSRFNNASAISSLPPLTQVELELEIDSDGREPRSRSESQTWKIMSPGPYSTTRNAI